MGDNSKQYGLIMPKKSNQVSLQPRLSAFDDNSDSGDEGGGDWVKKALKKESGKSVQKKQTKLEIQKALADDPTVYQYDEVYDEIEHKKAEGRKAKTDEKKPRYIHSLLRQAERRKKEQERRFERDVQREREAEAGQFEDKESFVTSAYRNKLEEFRQMDELERQQDHLEALTDVSKQEDLSGFYRHLYRQTMSADEPSSCPPVEDKHSIKPESIEKNQDADLTKEHLKLCDDRASKNKSTASEKNIENASRQYRKRRASSSEHDDRPAVHTKKIANSSNADEDTGGSSSDSSTYGSSSSSESEDNGNEVGVITADICNEPELSVNKEVESKILEAELPVVAAIVPKINIWEKRTVGPLFDAALERYYSRKAARLSSTA